MGGIPLDDEQQKVYRELSNEQVEFYNNLSDDEKKEYLKIKVPEEREQHWRRELDFPTPNSSQPVKDFHRRRQCNHHRRYHKGHPKHWIHARNKHMMPPDDKT